MANTAAQHSIRRHTADAAVGSAAASVRTPPPRLSGRNSYSLFVTSMKVVLPALAAGLVLLVVAWPQIMPDRSEEHTSELQSLMRSSYAVFCLKKKKITKQ